MRLLLLAVVPFGLLSACATTGYLLDQKDASKTVMIVTELGRYGLAGQGAQCVGNRLATGLTIWQLRQFAAAGAAVQASAGALTGRDMLRVATQIQDPKITFEVARAAEACNVGKEVAASAAPARDAEATAPEAGLRSDAGAPRTPSQSSGGGAPASSTQNGPVDYEPSAELVSALTAYERQDYANAARLAKAAAEKGDSGAQQLLGGLYSFGRGVPQDHAQAVKHYHLAAAQGWSEAMNNLGRAYETGQGVQRDPVEAMKWYLLASSRATEDSDMVKRNIQNLVYGMSAEQIQKAAALALDWNQGRGR